MGLPAGPEMQLEHAQRSCSRRRNEADAFLYAFDLLELDGTELRREPIETRKATLASILRKARHGIRFNEHLEHDCGLTVFHHACKMASKASCRSGSARAIGQAGRQIG